MTRATTYTVFLALWALPGTVRAEVGLAVKGGVTRSSVQVSGPGAFDSISESSFAVGVSRPLSLGPHVSFEPELFYAELKVRSDDFGVPAHIESRVVAFPLPLALQSKAKDRLRLRALAGPQLALVGRTRQRFGDFEEDISDDLRDLDLALLLGAGVDVRAGRGWASFEVRHAWGLRNLDETDEGEVKVRGLVFLAGYRF